VNKLTVSTVLIKKGKIFWKIFQKIFRFKFFREIFITSHITAWEEDYKGKNTSPSLQSPLTNSWSPSCTSMTSFVPCALWCSLRNSRLRIHVAAVAARVPQGRTRGDSGSKCQQGDWSGSKASRTAWHLQVSALTKCWQATEC
jgi:hypothetical protein